MIEAANRRTLIFEDFEGSALGQRSGSGLYLVKSPTEERFSYEETALILSTRDQETVLKQVDKS